MKTGIASLPLHHGHAPRWLFKRMVPLSGAIAEAIINEYGTQEFLQRMSNPYFFQSLSCAIGFDWHSSGTTTTTTGALKETLKVGNIGINLAGGKGKASRNTVQEIENSNLSDAKISKLQYASKMSAKVDNTVVQDGYQLYHHAFFFDEKGNYAIVQQGMNGMNKYARRYHWLSDSVNSFVEEPHAAVCCDSVNTTLNLAAKQSRDTRNASVDLVNDNPNHLYKYFGPQKTLMEFSPGFKKLHMTARHWIKDMDLTTRDKEILQKAYEFKPKNYEELISLQGMGAKKIRALALVSDLIYGTEASWKDPVKYSFAVGGKDGTPFPVDKKTYDHSISFLRNAIDSSKIGNNEKLSALKRLNKYIYTN